MHSAGTKNRRQFGWCDQQAKQEKDDDLGNIGHNIKKVDELALVRDAGVAHQDAAQVGAQIAVSAQTVGECVGNQNDGEYQNGLAVLIGKGQV